MRRFILAPVCSAFLSLLCLHGAAGQSGVGYTSVYLSGGLNAINFTDLNDRLKENNLPEVGSMAYGGSFGVYRAIDGRVIVGLEGTLYASQNREDSLRSNLLGGYGLLQVGYSLVHKRWLEFFPLVGVGYGSMRIGVRADLPEGSFPDNVSGPGNVRELTSRGPVILLGAGVQARFGQRNGYYLGARAGYVNMGNSGWRYSGGQLTDAPTASSSSFFLNLTLGMFLHDLY